MVGPYRLLQPIAEGGMGIVYRARELDSEARVALKLVRVNDASLLSSFRREIYALRAIAHPGVIAIVADGVANGQPWYAMPLCEGETLGDYIDRIHAPDSGLPQPSSNQMTSDEALDPNSTPPMSGKDLVRGERAVPSLKRSLALLRALCEPLAYVHGEGLVHRDLKPDNVLIGDDGRPILLDFGLALRFSGGESRDVLDVAGRALGTPPYMAPEQIRGDLVDARADLYALGCMMHECLTGVPPFSGTPVTILNKHIKQAPTPPSRVIAGVPPKLDAIVMRLLEKRPRDRFGYAEDVARALSEVGAKGQKRSSPPPRPYLYLPGLAGRGAVIEALREALEPRAERRGGVAFIGGRSGIGKTRLAMELATRAARHGHAVVAGHCQDVRGSGAEPAVTAAPLHPLLPLLQAIADHCQSGGDLECERLLGPHGAVLAAYEPAIASLPWVAARASVAELGGEAARLRLLDALRRAITAYAEVQSLFIVLDDVQWADELTLALLAHLDGSFFGEHDVFMVATYRIEETGRALATLVAAPYATSVELGSLGESAVRQMVGDMLALDEPPRALIAFVAREAEGNPFFIAEYLRLAISEQILRRSRSGVWSLGVDDDADAIGRALALPGGLFDVVRRRIDRLSAGALALLRVAAVLGREMDGDVLFAAAGEADASSAGAVRGALDELRGHQFIEEGERGSLRFVHAKLREVVYADIDDERRPRLHRAAAVQIEQHHVGRSDAAQSYPVLAHHYGMARERKKALHYLELAGEHALATGSAEEAKRHFERALAEGHDATVLRRAGWHRRIGEACYDLGELDAARDHLMATRRALSFRGGELVSSIATVSRQLFRMAGFRPTLCTGGEERARLREAALAAERVAQVHFFRNEQKRSFAAAMECAQLAEQLGPSPELARAYAVLSVAMSFVPARALSDSYGERAQSIAEQVGDRPAMSFVAFLRGLDAVNNGKHADAIGYLGHALGSATDDHDLRAIQEITAVLGQAHNLAGDRQSALACYAEVAESARRTRNRQAHLWAASGRAATLTWLGRAREAIATYEEIRPIARESGDTSEILSEGVVACAYLMEERWQDARAVADEILELCDGVPAAWHSMVGVMAMAETYLTLWERGHRDVRGRAGRACALFDKGSRVFRFCRPSALRLSGHHAWLAGDTRRARRYWGRALSESEALAMPFERGRVHFEIGRHGDAGDPATALHLSRSRRLFEQVEAAYWLERLSGMPRLGRARRR